MQNRVANGGHPVPEALILKRYGKSLDLLLNAIRSSDRAFLFDNSTDGRDGLCFAEFDGEVLKIRASPQPRWFGTYVLDKLPRVGE